MSQYSIDAPVSGARQPKNTEGEFSSGCIVVLEAGAKWPEEAFAHVPHRDSVVVFQAMPCEPHEHLISRLIEQFAHFRASGVLLGTVLIATAGGAPQTINRERLMTQLRESKEPPASVVFVTAGEG